MIQGTKICSKCKIEYPATLEYFYLRKDRKSGLKSWCKTCRKKRDKKYHEERKEYFKRYRRENREKLLEKQRRYRKENQGASDKKYYKKNREKLLLKAKEWKKNNIEKIREQSKKDYEKKKDNPKYKEYKKGWEKERKRKDPQYRLKSNFGTLIWYALKEKGSSKNGYSWEKIVNYTTQELMEHLENQFIEGMTWNNYGKWHVDHIKPISSFNFTSYEDDEFQECWALNNLQPLWAQDNLIKSNKIIKNKRGKKIWQKKRK